MLTPAGAAHAMDAADARDATAGVASLAQLRGLREALEEAVRLRIPDEVSYACALSGGLDSSAVLAMVTRLTGQAPPVFTVCFDGDTQGEWAQAAETARHFGAPHHAVELDDAALAEWLPAAVRAGEGNAINAHLVGKWALARAVAAAGHKVLLSGEGADEVTFGYAHFLVDAGFAPTAEQRASQAGAMLAPGSADARLPHFVAAKLGLGERLHELGEFGDRRVNARKALAAAERAVSAESGVDGEPPRGLERSRAWWRKIGRASCRERVSSPV